MEVERLTKVVKKEFGLSGDELREFVRDEQERMVRQRKEKEVADREARAEQLEIARQQQEVYALQIQLQTMTKDKTKKAEPNHIRWENSQESAFQTLKTCLVTPPVLHLPDPQKPFILQTDASSVGLGAVLLQEHSDEKFPVAYASRKLLPREQAYSTIEKECLAILWSVQKFQTYLCGQEFLLQTDHQPLTYLNQAKTSNARIMRWALQLQPYRFRLQSIKGKENVGADYLSRTTV